MTDSLLGPIQDLFMWLAVIGGGLLVPGAAIALAPRLLRRLRQRSYDRIAADELVRVELTPARSGEIDAAAATAVIRGLHPRQRRGFDRWRVGWPSSELRVVWRDGDLHWQVEGHHQVLDEFALSHRALHLVADARSSSAPRSRPSRRRSLASRGRRPGRCGSPRCLATASSTGSPPHSRPPRRPASRSASGSTCDRSRQTPGARSSTLSRRARARSARSSGRRSSTGSSSASRAPGVRRPVAPTPLERDARARKRRGSAGFETAVLLEVAGTTFEEAKALLWRLTDATDSLADAGQEIRWEVVHGAVSRAPGAQLADWEVAQLWYLPDETFEASELPRPRPLAGALPPTLPAGGGIVIGANGERPLAVPLATLDRHLAVVGSTGSGKSTLLLQLVTGLLDTGWGATVIDPHGDLVADILARVPPRHADRIHVLRLADRAHPRGFNFFECRTAEDAQLVTSEFVALFEDLWPRFTGPRMRDILRYSMLTMLSSPEPQTVLELDRILSDEAFRKPYIAHATDPAVQNYWRTRWPSKGSDDPSVGAVQNKLGAFIAYDSIRAVVGQGTSTLRPRTIMDRGDVLLVDLSQVGGDNASIMGGMLIARYRIDALGRQGTDPASRRPHLLVVDETPRFSTRALGGLMNEGRKFAVAVGLATQTLKDIGEALGATAVANAGTIALMAPGLDDAKALAPLFAPLTAADLLGMERHGMALKMAGPKGRDVVYGGIVLPPGPADPSIAAAILAASDARDARPRAEVAAEVTERLTWMPPKAAEPAKAS